MPKPLDVVVLIGSLRAESLTRKVANAALAGAPVGLSCRIVEIAGLSLYNQDLDDKPPAAWTRFRKSIAKADAVLIFTPEYNRSIPGCLKNALDIGSRPQGENLWDGKPAGVVSVTPYKMGAFGANHHVRQTLVFLNMPAMQQPEAYVGGAGELFDARGKLKNKDTAQFLSRFMTAFETWVETVRGSDPAGGFEAFMAERDMASAAYSSGDPKPLNAIAAEGGKATFFPPPGGVVTGAKAVTARYDADAKAFSPGAKNRLEVLDAGAASDLAFWTGLQHFEGKFRGKPTKMKLRVTEVFRLTGGEWKLVHRHADPAADPQKPPA